MSLFSMFFFISLYLQDVLGYDSPIQAGIAYLPLAVGIILSPGGVASVLVTQARLQDAVDRSACCSSPVGLDLVLPGARPTAATFYRRRARTVAAGRHSGSGFSFVPVTIAAVSGIQAASEAGLASGLINTSQQVGGALGLAILATIANSRTQDVLHAGTHSATVALTKGFDRAFLIGAGFAFRGCHPGGDADLLAGQPRARAGGDRWDSGGSGSRLSATSRRASRRWPHAPSPHPAGRACACPNATGPVTGRGSGWERRRS